MNKIFAVALLASLFPLTVQAAMVPDSGNILQQVQPSKPLVASPDSARLTVQQKKAADLPPSHPFMIKTIRITGNIIFNTATLHALVADAEGKKLTLSQLGELAARITDYYHRNDYPLAQTIIPAQKISDGMVTFTVIEARYGKILLNNKSRVSDSLLEYTLSPLESGQAVSQTELDHRLLLLSDIPGVVPGGTLKPGEAAGTSDLLVEAPEAALISGNVVGDNYGNRYTGRKRVGATININNPLNHGDVLSAKVLSSGEGLQYGRLAYETLLDGNGTRLGGSYSALHYKVGESLAPLDAHGSAQVGSLWAKRPLIRSPDFNLYGQVQYDRLKLRDYIDVAAIDTNRHLDNGTLSFNGDIQDKFLSGGINTWSLGTTAGRVSFDNEAAQAADSATAETQGGFLKGNANFSRLQRLNAQNNLYISFSGQWANANLDSSQKMLAGGPYAVRAYDVDAIAGDRGYQETAELRHDFGTVWNGQWQAVAFVDSAQITVNKSAWATGANKATLSGAGIGLNWAGPRNLSAKTYIATPIGPTPELVADTAATRAWIGIGIEF